MTRNERELLQLFRLLDDKEQIKIIGITEGRAEIFALQKQLNIKNAPAENKIKDNIIRPFG